MTSRTIRTAAQIPAAIQAIGDALRRGMEGTDPRPLVLSVKYETRRMVLNDLMWVKLTDFARCVEHDGKKHGKGWWKMILLSMYRRGQKRPPKWEADLDGYPVEMEGGTSDMGDREISDFITFIESEGSFRGVRWSAPKRYET